MTLSPLMSDVSSLMSRPTYSLKQKSPQIRVIRRWEKGLSAPRVTPVARRSPPALTPNRACLPADGVVSPAVAHFIRCSMRKMIRLTCQGWPNPTLLRAVHCRSRPTTIKPTDFASVGFLFLPTGNRRSHDTCGSTRRRAACRCRSRPHSHGRLPRWEHPRPDGRHRRTLRR